jgi:phage tail tape-measure protein
VAEAQIVVTADTRRAERALGRLDRSLAGIDRVAGIASAAIAGVITGGALKSIVDTTSRFQDLRTTLASVTGGAREGAKAFEFIQEFSTRTQFGIEELTQSYIKLQGAGIEPTEQLLTTFTDAAAVTTDQLGSLQAITDLFSRTVSGGLGLEELNRLADRGIPVFAILEEQIGKSRLEISEFGKTAEGARIITEALATGIEERFGGATASRLNNISTQFSNLQISITKASDVIGRQGFAFALGQAATELTNYINNNQQAVQEIGVRLTQAFLIAKDAIILVVENIEFLGKAFIAFFALGVARAVGGIALAIGGTLVRAVQAAGAAFVLFGKILRRNPLIAAATVIVGGIEALTGAFSSLAKEIGIVDAAGDALAGLGTVTEDIAESVGLSTESFEKFFANVGASEEEARALAARMTELQNNATTAAEATGNIADGADAAAGSLQGAADASEQLAERQRELESIVESVNNSAVVGLQNQLDLLDEAQAKYEETYGENLDAEREFQRRRVELHEAAEEAIQKATMDRITKTLQANTSGLARQLSAEDRAFLQREGQEERQAEIVRDRIEFEKKSEGEKAQFAIQKSAEVFDALGAQNKKAFEAAKALNIANALMNTYAAATKALATYPFPFGLVAAAAAVAAGMAQVSAIRSQQYSGRALGGPVMSNQSYIVGENGPELFTPNTSGGITRNNQLGGGGTTNVNFTIVANDTTGFDELLTSRQGLIRTIISDAMLENGQRSMV